MKTIYFQKLSKKLLPFAFMCGLLLLFTAGLKPTGSDLAVLTAMENSSTSKLMTSLSNSGGNFISAFLGAIFLNIPVLRHVLMTAMLALVLITMVHFCKCERPCFYFAVLFFGLCPPGQIFAHSFGRMTGAVAVLLPAFFVILYLFSLSDLYTYRGQKKSWKIPVFFVWGLLSQLFTESIAVAILLLSVLSLFLFHRKYRFSWHLASHTFGCLVGLTISMVVSGGYDGFVNSIYAAVDRLTLSLDLLFVENLLLLVLLTLAALLLIQPIRAERSKNCNRTLFLILVPMALFVIFRVANPVLVSFVYIYRFITVVKVIAVLAYCYGILRTLQHYISKDSVITKIVYCFITIGVFVLVFSLTENSQPNVLYIPYLCLVASTVLLYLYALRRYSRLEKVLRKPLFIAALIGVFALSFITMCNGRYFEAVDTHIHDCIKENTQSIILPEPAYPSHYITADQEVLKDYYQLNEPDVFSISYVPFGEWDWEGYYDAHNVPVIEELDEDELETEDVFSEFEEEN